MGNERNDHRLRANCNSSFSLCLEFLVLGITSVPKEKREDNGGSAHGYKCKPFHLGGRGGGGGGGRHCVYIQHRQWEDEDEYDCVCEGVVT